MLIDFRYLKTPLAEKIRLGLAHGIVSLMFTFASLVAVLSAFVSPAPVSVIIALSLMLIFLGVLGGLLQLKKFPVKGPK
jgi:hypothetical protein